MAEVARPLADRIVVKRDEVQTHSPGGIVLVQNKRQQPNRGEVVAVGPGAYSAKGTLIPMSLKAGDRVIFGNYAGTTITINGDSYAIMREGDCSAVIEGEGGEIEAGTNLGPRDENNRWYDESATSGNR
jgi:chaperonin GroES